MESKLSVWLLERTLKEIVLFEAGGVDFATVKKNLIKSCFKMWTVKCTFWIRVLGSLAAYVCTAPGVL